MGRLEQGFVHACFSTIVTHLYGLLQTTVHEALLFSARCRLSKEHDSHTVAAFSTEVRPLTNLLDVSWPVSYALS